MLLDMLLDTDLQMYILTNYNNINYLGNIEYPIYIQCIKFKIK